MTQTIPQRMLDNHAGQVLDGVERGEDYIVTRRGVPVARIVPLLMSNSERIAQMEATGEIEPNTARPQDFHMQPVSVDTSWEELRSWDKE